MCQQHGQITFRHSQRRKQKHQTDSCYDLRVQDRKVIDGKYQFLQHFSGFGKADGCNSSQHCGNNCCQDCHCDRNINCLADLHVVDQLPVPAQGKSCKSGQGLGRVKGKNHSHKDRQVKKCQTQHYI